MPRKISIKEYVGKGVGKVSEFFLDINYKETNSRNVNVDKTGEADIEIELFTKIIFRESKRSKLCYFTWSFRFHYEGFE